MTDTNRTKPDGRPYIERGDVVMLRTGGPNMTAGRIVVVDALECWLCQWFMVDETLREGVFTEASLDLVPPIRGPE